MFEIRDISQQVMKAGVPTVKSQTETLIVRVHAPYEAIPEKIRVYVSIIPTIPLKKISLCRVFVPSRPPSCATRRANATTAVTQMDVDIDSMTVMAMDAGDKSNLMGHINFEGPT